MRACLLLLLVAMSIATDPARANPNAREGTTRDATVCAAAIAAAERQVAVPPLVLGAIATVESGRPLGRRLVPWPWSINAEGVGHAYSSKADAIAAVQALRSAGLRSIDVGCMQINLAAHPQAFASLDDAFDPAANAAYAARFVRALYRQTGRLATAMTAYHSHTPAFAADYARRLLAVWPAAAAFGLGADLPAALPRSGPSRQRPDAPGREPSAKPSLLQIVSIRGSAWPQPAVRR